jgi:hypothetical protein
MEALTEGVHHDCYSVHTFQTFFFPLPAVSIFMLRRFQWVLMMFVFLCRALVVLDVLCIMCYCMFRTCPSTGVPSAYSYGCVMYFQRFLFVTWLMHVC